MAIPEAQLETWSRLGPTAQFTSTYESIRNVLLDVNAPYANRSFNIFLQGSYKNDTNVYGDSDVDVVICTDAVYYADTSNLDVEEKQRYDGNFVSAQYTLEDFKSDVLSWLMRRYPNDVTPGNKAVYIRGNAGRRDADVVIAAEFRRYYAFPTLGAPIYEKGICFFASDGTRIENFPKQHSDRCSEKNQANGWFKRTIRTYKNLRNKMIADHDVGEDMAPSYFLEGLLYNVPDTRFGGTYMQNFDDTLNWLVATDRGQFLCTNGLYYLLHPTSPVTWRAEKCTAFLNAAVRKRDTW